MAYDRLLRQMTTAAKAGTPTPPSGPAGGDLSGTYPNPTVAKINGNPLGNTAPTSGNILVGDGVDWESVPVSGDASLVASGALTLASIIAAGGPVGDGTHVAQITWDAKGRLLVVTSVPITFPASDTIVFRRDFLTMGG